MKEATENQINKISRYPQRQMDCESSWKINSTKWNVKEEDGTYLAQIDSQKYLNVLHELYNFLKLKFLA